MTRTGYRPRRCRRPLTMFVLIAACSIPAAARAEAVADAKALYLAASYEEALAALGGAETPEAHEYRGLCLLALGRLAEAGQAIEALVATAPGFTLGGEDYPPRFVALFEDTRRRALPEVARGRFARAREQYQAKAYEEARKEFDLVLALTNDPQMKDSAEAADLQLLAEGFVDLLAAADAARDLPPEKPEPTPPVPEPTAPAPPVVVQPVAIRMTVPPLPAAVAAANRPLTGTVRVLIGENGRVKEASIEAHLHPQYDLDLLAATRSWLFRPATINGMPVESEQTIPVQIEPKSLVPAD